MPDSTHPVENLNPAPGEPAGSKARGRVRSALWIALAALGGLVFFGLSWAMAHSLSSIIDEGLYLYKGYLFTSGTYIPFQDGGPWTNHMPFSFLIPGWVQQIFGLGLRTGRYYALALEMLMLLGVWVNARRLGGLAWAAAAVWMIGVNTFYTDVYSKAQSQVLIACMLAWVLVLTLGRRRPMWQIALGAALAGLTLVTRINLLFLLPLLLAYIFWEHGRRAGIWATAISLMVFGSVHLIYWPDILKLWAKWLPETVTPFLSAWREPATVVPAWDPQIALSGRLASLSVAMKQNPALWVGGLAALLMWPNGPWDETQRSIRRTAVFLLLLGGSLTALHAWAALGNNYCVYCLTSYLAFFAQLGVYLIVIAGAHWYRRISPTRRLVGLLTLLVVGVWLWAPHVEGLARSLRGVRIPRMADMRVLPGTTTVAGLIKNLFDITGATTETVLRGFVFGGVVVVFVMLLWLAVAWARRRSIQAPLAGLAAALGLWLLAFSLGFSTPMTKTCSDDAIRGYELAGEHLARWVPPGSKVYWAASASPAPLLYIPEAQVFPAQLNGDYTFRLNGDPNDLTRFGSWNAEMAARWMAEADYVLIFTAKPGVASKELDPVSLDELPATPPLLPCQPDSVIRLFRRLP